MKSTNIRRTLNAQIIDEAAAWLVEFSSGDAGDTARREFDIWLRKSPEHVRAYLELFSIWEETPYVDAGREVDSAALIALARTESNVRTLDGATPAPQAHHGPARKPRRFLLAATFLLTCAAGFLSWFHLTQRHVYETDVGEQRVVTLKDGSSIELNARSRIRVRYTEHDRSIELFAGQALFRVAKDPTRPFEVHSGNAVVRAVGTQFDVYRKRSGTVVTVIEGQVAVLPASSVPEWEPPDGPRAVRDILLSAGHQLTLSPQVVLRPQPVNIASATAWARRRLIFDSTPLPEVAEEFNRYNERRLIVRDPALAGFLVSGVFSSADPQALLRFLREQPGIRVEETDDEIRITAH